MLHQNDGASTNAHERMSIFAAYAFPGNGPAPYPTITLITAVRLLATRHLEAMLRSCLMRTTSRRRGVHTISFESRREWRQITGHKGGRP